MSRTKRKYRKNANRRIWVQGERHDPPDTHRLSRALLDLAAEMAAAKVEADAQAQMQQRDEAGEPDREVKP